MYFCRDCGRQFQRGQRIDNVCLWSDYLTEKRTISELSTLHKCSERTIRRRLSSVADSFTPIYPESATIILDTTYFSKTFGVMLFQDAASGRILHRRFVRNETNKGKHPILAVFPTNKQPLYVWQQIRVVCYLQFEGSIFVSSSSVMSSNGFERISFIHSYGSMSASLQHAMKV